MRITQDRHHSGYHMPGFSRVSGISLSMCSKNDMALGSRVPCYTNLLPLTWLSHQHRQPMWLKNFPNRLGNEKLLADFSLKYLLYLFRLYWVYNSGFFGLLINQEIHVIIGQCWKESHFHVVLWYYNFLRVTFECRRNCQLSCELLGYSSWIDKNLLISRCSHIMLFFMWYCM